VGRCGDLGEKRQGKSKHEICGPPFPVGKKNVGKGEPWGSLKFMSKSQSGHRGAGKDESSLSRQKYKETGGDPSVSLRRSNSISGSLRSNSGEGGGGRKGSNIKWKLTLTNRKEKERNLGETERYNKNKGGGEIFYLKSRFVKHDALRGRGT